MSASIRYIDAGTVLRLLSPTDAVQAIRRALQAGYRPEHDHRRTANPLSHGEFLLMPSEAGDAAGIKVLTVAPGNPARGLPRIQGVYVLLDARTLAPRYLIDGPSLTELRTAAVSLAAVKDALAGDSPLDVAVFGTGPQGLAHVRTLHEVLEGTRAVRSVTALVRGTRAVASGGYFTHVARIGSTEAGAALAAAGLIICATTARTPLFDGSVVRDDAIVIAVGSHEPDARELPSSLMGRADVIVEDLAAALRECGDVIMAIDDGSLSRDRLLLMADIVSGSGSPHGDRPIVFKSAGMPWEDLVIAAAVADAHDRQSP
mgnify:CR=1 FL=1